MPIVLFCYMMVAKANKRANENHTETWTKKTTGLYVFRDMVRLFKISQNFKSAQQLCNNQNNIYNQEKAIA